MKKAHPFDRLLSVVECLRKECPWDREQTLSTLIPFIIEEAYEVVGAIESGSFASIKEELGDLLLQIIFVSQIAKEKNAFTVAEVIEESAEKMRRRHPHLFGEAKAETAGAVIERWEEIKKEEKKKGYLRDLHEAMPALLRARKITERAAKVGFDWKDAEEVMKKFNEELEEFKRAISEGKREDVEEELGDMLFTLVNASRFVQVNPEEALRKTIGKFVNRFHYIEKKIEEEGKSFSEITLEDMEKFWNEAKKK